MIEPARSRVKEIAPCPTSEHTNALALYDRFRQALLVRWLPLLIALGTASTASADRRKMPAPPSKPRPPTAATRLTLPAPVRAPSNPAFLGIRMEHAGNGCLVEGVTAGSSAQDAGLRALDIIQAIDDAPTLDCITLRNEILGKSVGQVIKLDVRRAGERIVLRAPLSTRAEVLHRRLVGHQMESVDVIDADDSKQTYDLADTRSKTTVLAWFRIELCAGCNGVIDRVNDAIAKRLTGESAPFVLAVTDEPKMSNTVALAPQAQLVPSVRKAHGFTTSVPLALASKQAFEELAIDDPERAYFVVIDCRGVVRFVAPIAPGSDDIDAAIDEVLAAVEQSEHLRTQRR